MAPEFLYLHLPIYLLLYLHMYLSTYICVSSCVYMCVCYGLNVYTPPNFVKGLTPNVMLFGGGVGFCEMIRFR